MITEETYFTKEVSKLKIGIMVRDCEIGRAGNSTSHQGAPSIKIFDMDRGKKTNHSKDGILYILHIKVIHILNMKVIIN